MNIFLILIYLLIAIYFISLWKIFEKAGEEKWKGFVPIYNFVVWLKIMNKPWWWVFLLFIPTVNIIMIMIMHVELARSFGDRTWKDYILALFLPHVIMLKLAYDKNEHYIGPIDWTQRKKSKLKEWGDAILFAVVAATIIRVFFLEAFTIPTPSMEKSLLVGDYLFVSKVSYGARPPMTPLAVPFTHHTIPGVNTKSYVEWLKLPYTRLPGFGNVERNDVVVFNFPAGDSVMAGRQNQTFYKIIRQEAFIHFLRKNNIIQQIQQRENKDEITKQALKEFWKVKGKYLSPLIQNYWDKDSILVRPVDKRENYIKRAVAVAGDTLEIIDRKVHINGQPVPYPEDALAHYEIKFEVGAPTSEEFYQENKIARYYSSNGFTYHIHPDREKEIEALPEVMSVKPAIKERGFYHSYATLGVSDDGRYRPSYLPIYPNHIAYQWTEDNFGPLYIPKEGATIDITTENLPLYQRIIDVYEENDLEVRDGEIFINGERSSQYTFKQNYYWLMGDNRHNSADSRFWGFVPMDHVVGKAVFIWFSKGQEGIRWNRIFSVIR